MAENINLITDVGNNSLLEDSSLTNNKMPQNLEAEQGLIGSILFDNKTLEDLPISFDSKHFFDPIHASIFDACVLITDNGRLADPITLKGYLKDENSLWSY
jgi:replicative DNA helicase